MDITEIDKNFKLPEVNEPDIEWFDARETPFALHGVFFDEKADRFLRMPDDVSKKVSVGVHFGAYVSTGGRLRFSTNSPYIAIKAIIPSESVMNHMPVVGSHGFSLYCNHQYKGMFTPASNEIIKSQPNPLAFQGIRYIWSEKVCDFDLYFPLYGGVIRLYIGLKKGCVLNTPKPYTRQKPIVFYGSSITQGGCASRPGNDYVSLVCKWLDSDFINLGFSGNAKGEKAMAEHLASLDASVFVLDYDYNAPNAEHLQATHYPLYERIRTAHKDTPILFISKPDFEYDGQSAKRRAVIMETYEKAKANGDKNVAFIDGETLFGTFGRDGCTVDTCHPNDLGFYRMAETVYPVLKELLK